MVCDGKIMTKKQKHLHDNLLFLFGMLGCLYGQEHYGTIQIDKDDVQIGMSENL